MKSSNYSKRVTINIGESNLDKIEHKLIKEAQNCYDKNHLEQANCLYQKVLQSDEKNVDALNGLGLIAMNIGMMSLALEFFQSACDLAPKNMTINKNLASALVRTSNYDDAILQYISMLDIDENDSQIHAELARLNMEIGQLDLALHYYRHAFYLDPENPENLKGIVSLNIKSITKNDIDTVEKLLDQADLPLASRCSFYYALGHIFDSRSQYDVAFSNYSVANLCKGVKFNSDEFSDYVTDIINTFSSDLFEHAALAELGSKEQPIFIVGMPYSGTTLVEQILASHSKVFTAGETRYIEDMANKFGLYNGRYETLSVSANPRQLALINELAQFYLSRINRLALNNDSKKSQVITSKLQNNFIYIGLIALVFPNAKIIHCRRDAMDICFSCFLHDMSNEHAYANDITNVALYYQQYEQIMQHWAKVLPIEIHSVEYDALLCNTQVVSKQIINYVGLEWQKQCFEFYDAKHPIAPSNVFEKRDDAYALSLNKWQNYKKYLHLLNKTLGLTADLCHVEEQVLVNPHDFKKDFKASKFII